MEANEYQKMFDFEQDYWWYCGLHDLVRRWVQRAPGGAERRILDAGCGTGRTLERLKGTGRGEGVDYSAQAIACCRQRGLEAVRVADLNDWRGEASAYDVIVSLDVVCTDGVRDDNAVFSEFHQALKPGGWLILNLPAFMLLRREHDIAVSGRRRYRRNPAMKQLAALGFVIERAGYRLPLLFLAILARKPFESLRSGPAESDLRPLPGWLNRLLRAGHLLENRLFTGGLSFPFGSSLFLVCRKA
jgi:SAM-dependent methyltransferase